MGLAIERAGSLNIDTPLVYEQSIWRLDYDVDYIGVATIRTWLVKQSSSMCRLRAWFVSEEFCLV